MVMLSPSSPQLKFDPKAPFIPLKAEVKSPRGVEIATLALDTGSTYVILPWHLATALGLKFDPTKTVKTTTVSTVESSPLTSISQLTVLGQSVKNVSCLIRDLPGESGVDGLLGLSFLKHFKLEIDFKRGILQLA